MARKVGAEGREDDEVLLGRLHGEGGERALKELFERYYTPLTVFSAKLIGDADMASDVVQNTFIALYEREGGETIGNVRSFLFNSVRNASLNVVKHEKVKRQYADITMATESELSDQQADHLVEETEARRRMAEAMASLPPQCRKIFEMSRLEGKSNQEIADETGLTKRTVETQISKALKTLRKLFGMRNDNLD